MQRGRERALVPSRSCSSSALGRLAVLCFRHGVRTLLAAAALAVVAAFGASRLKLDPDISELLPPSYESVSNVETLRERFGGVGNVVVVVRGGTPEARRAFADRRRARARALADACTTWTCGARSSFSKSARSTSSNSPISKRFATGSTRAADTRWRAPNSTSTTKHHRPSSSTTSGAKYENRLERRRRRERRRERVLRKRLRARRVRAPDRPRVEPRFLAQGRRRRRAHASRASRPQSSARGSRSSSPGATRSASTSSACSSATSRSPGHSRSASCSLYVALHFRRVSAVLLVMAPLLFGLELVYGARGVRLRHAERADRVRRRDSARHRHRQRHSHARSLRRGAARRRRARAGRLDRARRRRPRLGRGRASRPPRRSAASRSPIFAPFASSALLSAAGMLLLLGSYVTVLPALLGLFTRFMRRGSRPRRATSTCRSCRGSMRAAPWVAGVLVIAFVGLSARAPAVHFDADFAALDRANLPSFHLDPRSEPAARPLADAARGARRQRRAGRRRRRCAARAHGVARLEGDHRSGRDAG